MQENPKWRERKSVRHADLKLSMEELCKLVVVDVIMIKWWSWFFGGFYGNCFWFLWVWVVGPIYLYTGGARIEQLIGLFH